MITGMQRTPRARVGRPRTRSSEAEVDGPVRALDRGLAILIALGDARPRTLTEIGDAVGLPYSTVHRLLATLAGRGFVEQVTSSGRYRVGVRAFEVGASFVGGGLTEAAHEPMAALRSALDETVNLAVRDGDAAVYLHQVEGQRKVRMFTRVGARVPLHCTGVGKALLAWEPDDVVRTLVSEIPKERHTETTITETRALLADLAATAERGHALDMEEYEAGVRCVAVPVRGPSGEVIGALSVSAPTSRFDDDRLAHVARSLGDCATEASRRTGWTPP